MVSVVVSKSNFVIYTLQGDNINITELVGRGVSTPASYQGGHGFKSRSTGRLSRLRFFCGFPQFL
jgi:hypothetical protein